MNHSRTWDQRMQLCMVDVFMSPTPLISYWWRVCTSWFLPIHFFQLRSEFYECIYHHLESLRWPNVSLGEEVHSRNMAPWHVENGDPILNLMFSSKPSSEFMYFLASYWFSCFFEKFSERNPSNWEHDWGLSQRNTRGAQLESRKSLREIFNRKHACVIFARVAS